MYLRGHTVYTENLIALTRNQNNVEKAIASRKPSELDTVTANLKAKLKTIGAPAIKNV